MELSSTNHFLRPDQSLFSSSSSAFPNSSQSGSILVFSSASSLRSLPNPSFYASRGRHEEIDRRRFVGGFTSCHLTLDTIKQSWELCVDWFLQDIVMDEYVLLEYNIDTCHNAVVLYTFVLLPLGLTLISYRCLWRYRELNRGLTTNSFG
ncbi:hypothetical protein Cni_G00162 [Canna indica]|uniref:Uncharacterized protein n=1 Tax=Canna indica TaxID=4628 RepID=A0AAQ3JKY0_9LILI|nr:hypothetical protein Cni_G00162 [Canna indica]